MQVVAVESFFRTVEALVSMPEPVVTEPGMGIMSPLPFTFRQH
jgi:hypothetical protein